MINIIAFSFMLLFAVLNKTAHNLWCGSARKLVDVFCTFLLARLMCQYCFAGWHLLSVVVCRGL